MSKRFNYLFILILFVFLADFQALKAQENPPEVQQLASVTYEINSVSDLYKKWMKLLMIVKV